MIRAIAFDWGGVFTEGTFDSSAIRALTELSQVDAAAMEAAYLPLMAELEEGAFDLAEFRQRLQQRLGVAMEEHAFEDAFLGAVRWRPSMVRLLRSIPERYVVGMLSNNVPTLCDLVRNNTRMDRIERFVFSNEIRVRKPEPLAFDALTEALGVPPRDTVFIDDNAANIEACQALGFTGLLVDGLPAFAEGWRRLLPGLPLPPGLG
ncbi:MAG TPA: HAD family phosphatase [Trueperaceae bacterium]|nr:HAD family phosphatase [Trueperaceae bacterium]